MEIVPSYNEIDHLAEQTAAFIELLNQALEDVEDINVRELHGSGMLEGEEIYRLAPEDATKVMVKTSLPENNFEMYYTKTDVHGSPEPFHMPDGNLKADKDYTAYGIASTDNGLRIHIGYQGRGWNYFYTKDLDGLEFKVVDKTPAELTQDHLIKQHREAITGYERNVFKSKQLQDLIKQAEEAVGQLPVFPLESPYRYRVDMFFGGSLYHIGNGNIELIDEFTIFKNEIHGNFLGNRITIVEGKMLLIDDETNLAVGVLQAREDIYNRIKQGDFVGLGYIDVIDDVRDEFKIPNIVLNKKFLERLEAV